MHELVFFITMVWSTALLVACVAAVIRLHSTAARILALDTLTLILAALLIIYAIVERSPYYMDAALILALLAFVSTLVASRYYGERKLL